MTQRGKGVQILNHHLFPKRPSVFYTHGQNLKIRKTLIWEETGHLMR